MVHDPSPAQQLMDQALRLKLKAYEEKNSSERKSLYVEAINLELMALNQGLTPKDGSHEVFKSIILAIEEKLYSIDKLFEFIKDGNQAAVEIALRVANHATIGPAVLVYMSDLVGENNTLIDSSNNNNNVLSGLAGLFDHYHSCNII